MPTTRSNRWRRWAVLAAIACAACAGDPTSTPATKSEDDLSFLLFGPDVPPPATTVATFYAKRGSDREIRMFYRPRPGRSDSTEFLRFRVRARSLLRRPDGSGFANGDSILVTVRVADASRLVLEFQPSGLRFDPNEPAELKLSFAEKEDDLNDDGEVDQDDSTIRAQLAIWRQESAGAPWLRLGSFLLEEDDELEADLFGFTSYAIAY